MAGREIVAIDGVLRRYEWGSPSAIPTLLGLEPDGRPAAELWFGAHPDDPSAVPVHGAALDAVIAADPEAALGADVVEQFGPQLPFLLKILAADKALSIQVHPNRQQARDGFAAEDAAGIDRGAPNRNYRDANHKPELLCALTPFDAFCGFRPIGATLELLDELDLPELAIIAEQLRGPDPLRAAFTALLRHPDPAPVVDAVARRVADADHGPLSGPLRAVRLAAEDFPGDAGVLLALLLNHVRLAPGEAIYLAAGNVHAYVRGTGVEIMANSDNVLRCGLTPKHVDVDELLKITDFTELLEPRWTPVGGTFDVPVPDFRLTRLEIEEPAGLHDRGPAIVLCTSGALTLAGLELAPGHAAFVPAAVPATVGGAGVAFIAGAGL